MGKKGKGNFELKELKINTLILNEKQVLREIVQGKRPLPKYFEQKKNEQLFITRLYNFYSEEGLVDILEELEKILPTFGYEISGKGLKNKVKQLKENKKPYRLMDLKEPIKIYDGEVEAIKQFKDRTTQRVAFSVLLLTKIENEKRRANGNEPKNVTYYIPSAYFTYATVTVGSPEKRAKFLHKLHEAGIIEIDLKKVGLYCPIVKTEGKVVYDVVDAFESSKEHFDKIFGVEEETKAKKQKEDSYKGRIVVEIFPNTGQYKIGTYEDFNIRNSWIEECATFKRKHTKQRFFMEIPVEIKDDEEKLKFAIGKFLQLTNTRKALLKTMDEQGIYNEFQEFIKSLLDS